MRGILIAVLVGVIFAWTLKARAQEQGHEHDYEVCKAHEDQAERCRCECLQYHCDFYRACNQFEDRAAAAACYEDVSKATENCKQSCEAT